MNAPQQTPAIETAAPGPERGDAPPGPGLRLLRLALFALVLGALGYWGYRHYLLNAGIEKTDNAYIEARVVHISPRVPGPILRLRVTDNQVVETGELLAEIDPRDYEIQVAQAQATLDAAIARRRSAETSLAMMRVTSTASLDEAGEQLAAVRARELEEVARVRAAEAEMERAQSDYRRMREMAANLVSPQQLDLAEASAKSSAAALEAAQRRVASTRAEIQQAEARLRSADTAPLQVQVTEAQLQQYVAEVAQAEAALEQARLNLSYTRITAPEAGRISKRSAEQGAYVQAGSAILTLTTHDVWVVANYKETQLTGMHPGQPATIEVDAYPAENFSGRVDSIQAGTGARFSLLPPENATGNFVKVVQRVPVKIVFDPPPPDPMRLVPGMSVVPRVRTQ